MSVACLARGHSPRSQTVKSLKHKKLISKLHTCTNSIIPNYGKNTVTGKYDQLFYKPWLKHGRFITGNNVRLKNMLKLGLCFTVILLH